MASIFKAQDLHNRNEPVAVKVPHKEVEYDTGFSARFQREEEIGPASWIIPSFSEVLPGSK